MQRMIALGALACGALVGGCGMPDPLDSPQRQVNPGAFGVAVDSGGATQQSPQTGPTGTVPPPPPPPPEALGDATPVSSAQGPNIPPAPPPPPESPGAGVSPSPGEQPEEMVRQKAEVGVGKRGRGYGGGLITTPVATYFAARERIVFDIQIPEAMKMYKALHEHGPKTHEEFMEKIIKENMIRLPDLPPGHRYLYDPQSEQLFVERPADN